MIKYCKFSKIQVGDKVIKFPYVAEYSLFERVEFRVAEEILRDYNDFFKYNESQYNDIFRKAPGLDGERENPEDEKERLLQRNRAEQNAKGATDHFRSLFASKDFAESALVGYRIAWDDLQQILIEEFRAKIPAQQSAMNDIAPKLRTIASIVLFAEYMVSKLGKMYKTTTSTKPADIEKTNSHNAKVDETLEGIKVFFGDFLSVVQSSQRVTHEYAKSKNALAKLKTPEAVIEFCKNLLV